MSARIKLLSGILCWVIAVPLAAAAGYTFLGAYIVAGSGLVYLLATTGIGLVLILCAAGMVFSGRFLIEKRHSPLPRKTQTRIAAGIIACLLLLVVISYYSNPPYVRRRSTVDLPSALQRTRDGEFTLIGVGENFISFQHDGFHKYQYNFTPPLPADDLSAIRTAVRDAQQKDPRASINIWDYVSGEEIAP